MIKLRTITCGCLAAVFSVSLVYSSTVLARQDAPKIDDGFRPPQSVDGSQSSGTQEGGGLTSPGTDNLTSSDSQGQRVFDALFQELDNMIPGDFEPNSEVKQAMENAVTAFQVQDLARVRSIFEQQAADNPAFPPADLMMAALSYAVQDERSGLILLERAAIEHPEYPGVFSSFGRLAINQGRISDALAMLEKAEQKIEASTLDDETKSFFRTQVRDGLIDVAMRQRRYDDAQELLTRQREALPNNPKVLMVSAELEFQQGNIDESLKFLETVNSKFSQTRKPESILAGWYNRTGKPDKAEEWIRKAAEKYPEEPQVQLEFASWAIDKEDFPTASSAIIKAEKAAGESLFSRNLKGKIAFAKQSYGIAESHFQAIAEKQPNNFDAVNMYALSLVESGDEKKQQLARDIAMRNFRALPENQVAQAALGYIELKLGQTQQAKTILVKAAQSGGSVPEIDYFLAALMAELGETEQAKLVVENALKHEGIFLYRSAAQQLLSKIEKQSTLPSPDK